MSDYHERFKERFSNVGWHPDNLKRILAFIDEVVAETRAYDNETTTMLLDDLRKNLIEKVEGMRRTDDTQMNADHAYDEALDDILSDLREPSVSDFFRKTGEEKRDTMLAVAKDAANDQRKQIGLEPLPDASQGCCVACALRNLTLAERCTGTCRCHSPQGDNQTKV